MNLSVLVKFVVGSVVFIHLPWGDKRAVCYIVQIYYKYTKIYSVLEHFKKNLKSGNPQNIMSALVSKLRFVF